MKRGERIVPVRMDGMSGRPTAFAGGNVSASASSQRYDNDTILSQPGVNIKQEMEEASKVSPSPYNSRDQSELTTASIQRTSCASNSTLENTMMNPNFCHETQALNIPYGSSTKAPPTGLSGQAGQTSTLDLQQFHPNTHQIKMEPPDNFHPQTEKFPSSMNHGKPEMSYGATSLSFHGSEIHVNGVGGSMGSLATPATTTIFTSQSSKAMAASSDTSRHRLRNKCVLCGKGFSLRLFLRRHLKSHTKNNRSRKSKFVHHSMSSKDNSNSSLKRRRKKKCSSALRTLFRNAHMRNQRKTQEKGLISSNSSCFVCQKFFNYKSVFKLHMMKSHPVSSTTGDLLQFVYENNESSSFAATSISAAEHGVVSLVANLSQGRNRTTKEKRYKCPLCDKSFTQSGKLSSHKKKHTGEKPFHCSVCGKDFVLKDHLNIHIKIHTGEKPYACTICDKAFRQGGHLRIHMQTHTGVKPHKCETCNKAFSQKGSLMSHMRTHTGEKLQHQCTMCDKSFRDSTKLNNHVRTHTGEKPFQCSLCDKAFSQSGDLVRHIRTHTGEKPYACTVCNKQFSEGSNLNKHMRTHTGYRPHECNICHKAFSEGSTLKNHLRIHSGEKPYKCSVCQKEFIQSGDLYKHMRTHTGEKPHMCKVCGRAFTESSTLRKHMKTHRKDGVSSVDAKNIDINFDNAGQKNVESEGGDAQHIDFGNMVAQDIHFHGINPQTISF